MKILLVSQMYPGADDPDLGVFVQDLERALAERGHEIERAVIDRRAGGRGRYLGLARTTIEATRRFRPDVVYAHVLVPAGLVASLATRAPLVVTAHGQDVANIGRIGGVRLATRYVCRRARVVIAVSDFLRRALEARVPEARGKTEVVDCGVDLDRFRVLPAPAGPTAFLFVGTLTERKNPVLLADAFASLEDREATLTIVGDGPLRPVLEGRLRVMLTGALPHEEVARRMAAAHVVCQPSLVEPFGQALLEAMACGRSVVATRIGGPAEFVPDGAGVLVDPRDVHALTTALSRAASLPCPNPAARAAAESHDVRRQAERIEAILVSAATGSRGPALRPRGS
jgi:glycosyltransferase involved in cell wall biosynthesis